MKRVAICFMLINMAFGVATGQEPKEPIIERVVMVPPEIILPVIAYQADSPLQIEEIKLFQFVSGGGGSQSYKVRNKGTKPIRSYTIGTWNSVGTGWAVERPMKENLLPGQVATLIGNEVEVVDLTDALRNQLNLRGVMQASVVFMVVRVEYADGSEYNGEPLYKALKTHLDTVSLVIER
jgi:hypothetical protein